MSGVGAYTALDPCTPRPSKLVASTATRDFSYLKNVFCARARRAGAMRGTLFKIDIKSCSRRTGPNEGRGKLACGTHVAHQYGCSTLLHACVGPVRPVDGLYRDFL